MQRLSIILTILEFIAKCCNLMSWSVTCCPDFSLRPLSDEDSEQPVFEPMSTFLHKLS